MGGRRLLLQARQELNPQPLVLETSALPIELLAFNSVSRIPGPYKKILEYVTQEYLLRLAMHRVVLAARAIFLEFQPVWIIAPVFFRYVIAFFAVIACQDDHRANIFLF
jgi:hypothetical protein